MGWARTYSLAKLLECVKLEIDSILQRVDTWIIEQGKSDVMLQYIDVM